MIDKELLLSQDTKTFTTRLTWGIANRLRGLPGIDDDVMTGILYMLYRTSLCDDPQDVHLDDAFEFNRDIAEIVDHHRITSECWEDIKRIASEFTPEMLAAAVVIQSKHYNSNRDASTPESVLKLAEEILDVKSGDKVADICCGNGAFLIDEYLDNRDAEYFGYEINFDKYAISKIRSEILDADIRFERADAFDLVDRNIPKFNKIFSNYPFALDLRGNASYEHYVMKFKDSFKLRSSDWFFNALMTDLLEDSGKAVGIMVHGSTETTHDEGIRKYFIDNGLVEAVISLPSKMFEKTNIPTAMIIMSRKNNKAVRFVDASEICQKGRRINEFSDDDIAKILEGLEHDIEYSKLVSVEDIAANGYALNYSSYSLDLPEFDNGVALGSLVKSISRGAPCSASQLDGLVSETETDKQYLMISNIQDGIIHYEELPYLTSIDKKYEKYCLKTGDIILSKNGIPFKSAVVEVGEGKQILANGNLFILELDETKLDPFYLQAFLDSELGAGMLDNISVGSVIRGLGVDKLKNLVIPVPDMDEQHKIGAEYLALQDRILRAKKALDEMISHLHNVVK